MGLDLAEFALTERCRFLTRTGVTHVLCPQPVNQPQSQTNQCTQQPNIPHHLSALFHGKHFVRTVWTYEGLSADLSLPIAPPRLLFFYKIQESTKKMLAWGAHDLAIWPLDVETALLHEGLRRLSPCIILCFGLPGCAREVEEYARTQTPSGTMRMQLVYLPDLEPMLTGDKDLKNTAWKILQSLRRE